MGSGKTVLARKLSKKLSIPRLELDSIAFDKNWKAVDRTMILPDIASFMEQESWVIDGNYDDLMQVERLERADEIIFIMLPRLHCLICALKRTKERKLAGYHNDINPWFIRFLLFDCRNKTTKAAYKRIASDYCDKLTILKSQRDIDYYLSKVC